MKKSIFYFLIPCLVFFFDAHAQDVSLGIRGGISIPNLSAGSGNQNPLNTGYSSRSGPDAGIFAEFNFSNLFSLQPMLEYSAQGGKKYGMQAFPTPPQLAAGFQQQGQAAPTYLYDNAHSTAKINYLMLPVLAKFGWNFKSSPLRIYIDAGPFLGYLVSATQVISNSSGYYLDPQGTEPLQFPGAPSNINSSTDIKNQLYKFNFGIEGNVGLAYKLKKSSIFIEGGGNYGFLNIQKGTANGKNNIGAGIAAVGYSYTMGK